MYESWIKYSGQEKRQRKHPSREVYGEILKHAQLWNLTAMEAIKQISGGEG